MAAGRGPADNVTGTAASEGAAPGAASSAAIGGLALRFCIAAAGMLLLYRMG